LHATAAIAAQTKQYFPPIAKKEGCESTLGPIIGSLFTGFSYPSLLVYRICVRQVQTPAVWFLVRIAKPFFLQRLIASVDRQVLNRLVPSWLAPQAHRR
jgi:hypothetical protein